VVVSVQARADDGESWLRLVRQVEAAGFHTLYVPDHPAEVASPFVALGVAAAATDRVLLGSYVANAGL
jgi:alkanesulfonate monooxygenase SsuD/methylene tetrahydromethanopterin reductase-like flavin-dependent oxidoreductase (luciferase family)